MAMSGASKMPGIRDGGGIATQGDVAGVRFARFSDV
jgi:hypothetical protein